MESGAGTETTTISTFATIWLAVISSLVLAKTVQDTWAIATRIARSRNVPTRLGTLLGKAPLLTNYFAFVPVIVIIVVFITVGIKILLHSGLDPLIRIQVGLALGVVVGRLGTTIAMGADRRIRPVKAVYLIPVALVAGTLALGIHAMLAWCPGHLTGQWWMPCFDFG